MIETVYEYGAMSSKFSLIATNKLTAYSAMIVHYKNQPHVVAIYSPEESKKDSWLSFDGKVSERLDEIFGGKDSFDNYIKNNLEDIKKCLDTIKRLV